MERGNNMARTYRSKDRTRNPRGEAMVSLRKLEEREHAAEVRTAVALANAGIIFPRDYLSTGRAI